MWKLYLTIAGWLIAMVLLWMPGGLGSFMIPHADYHMSRSGVFGYYVLETKHQQILFVGVRPIPLLFTVAATLGLSFSTGRVLKRHFGWGGRRI